MVSAEDIISYLKANPDFFDEHEDLLAEIDLGSVNGAKPFYERQLQVLKERELQHKAKLELIVGSAQNNQKLETEIFEVAVKLLTNEDRGNGSHKFVANLIKKQFNVFDVVIIMNTDDIDDQHERYEELCQRVSHKSSVCDDRVSRDLLDSMFGDDSADIQSCAFVPLVIDQQLIGVMILGSNSVDRFQPDVGVMYLDRLGKLVASYLNNTD